MTLYETVIDTSFANSSHAQIVDLVGEDVTVLDVGCSVGYLADALKERGCTVSGIEFDADAAERARPKLDQLVVGDLNELPLAEAFAGRTFDRIVFGDVLEHLLDPAAVLRSALEILSPEGQVVISVPNVAHGSLRLALLQGRWTYRDTGLLDRTHIRFFTLDSLHELIAGAGLEAEVVRATTADPLTVEIAINDDALPTGIVEWVRHQPTALDYQYVVRASRVDPERPARERPGVVTAQPYDTVRHVDSHTRRALEAQQEEHRRLVMRDHVMGLEGQNARAEADLRVAQHEIDRLRRELAEVAEDRQQMRQSMTWRLGKGVTAPLRIARNVKKAAE